MQKKKIRYVNKYSESKLVHDFNVPYFGKIASFFYKFLYNLFCVWGQCSMYYALCYFKILRIDLPLPFVLDRYIPIKEAMRDVTLHY